MNIFSMAGVFLVLSSFTYMHMKCMQTSEPNKYEIIIPTSEKYGYVKLKEEIDISTFPFKNLLQAFGDLKSAPFPIACVTQNTNYIRNKEGDQAYQIEYRLFSSAVLEKVIRSISTDWSRNTLRKGIADKELSLSEIFSKKSIITLENEKNQHIPVQDLFYLQWNSVTQQPRIFATHNQLYTYHETSKTLFQELTTVVSSSQEKQLSLCLEIAKQRAKEGDYEKTLLYLLYITQNSEKKFTDLHLKAYYQIGKLLFLDTSTIKMAVKNINNVREESIDSMLPLAEDYFYFIRESDNTILKQKIYNLYANQAKNIKERCAYLIRIIDQDMPNTRIKIEAYSHLADMYRAWHIDQRGNLEQGGDEEYADKHLLKAFNMCNILLDKYTDKEEFISDSDRKHKEKLLALKSNIDEKMSIVQKFDMVTKGLAKMDRKQQREWRKGKDLDLSK